MLDVSEQTLHRWRNRFGGMKAEGAKRLRELERENQRLKQVVADQALDIQALKEIGRGKLLSPERRCRAVVMCVQRFGLSERRACWLVGQHRSTQRLLAPVQRPVEEQLRGRLREIAREHTRWRYRRAAVHLRREGWMVNHKRVQRLGPRVPAKTRKRRRGHSSDTGGGQRKAARPREVWAIDFRFDATNDGRQLKCLNIVDEFTRQALASEVCRSCDADGILRVPDRLQAAYGAPAFLRARQRGRTFRGKHLYVLPAADSGLYIVSP